MKPRGQPKGYLQARHATVRAALAELKLDGILLTHTADLAYVTGFTGHDSIGLVTSEKCYLVTDFRYAEQAEIEAPWLSTRLRAGKMSEALAKTLADSRTERIGYEANFTSVGEIRALEKELKTLGKRRAAAKRVKLRAVNDVLVKIRQVKDDHEIDVIRQAISAAEGAYLALRKQIKIGRTENYLAGLLGFEMRKRGASDASFETIIAAGAASSLPHYRPRDKVVTANQPLLIDWGARFGGYCSDLTRTLMLGRVSPKLKKVYNVVLEAQLAAIDFLKPGITNRQADRVARSIIAKAGFGKQFGHGLGHGIGLDIHELPTLRKTGEEVELRPGMIVTVEPGIYLPGLGGVRIEDDVLITPGGREVLTSLGKTFEECHID